MLSWIKENKMKAVGSIFGFILLAIIIFAGTLRLSPLSWGWYQPINTSGGIAIGGYDAVAYHLSDRATEGDESISMEWQGATWHFSSSSNLALFQSDPERYAPQFGGNCAQAVSSGLTAKVDPEAWHIEDGKLYLFLNGGAEEKFLSALPEGIISQSEAKWNSR